MNNREFRESIMSSFNRLRELGLTDWDRYPNKVSLETNQKFKNIALNRASKYEDIYRKGLSLSYYNFMLDDYSYFQFYLDSNHGNIHQIRYAFYPNPYEIPQAFESFSQEMISEGEAFGLGELYIQSLDEAEICHLYPPIRYDFDPENHTATRHPAGHFHIGAYQGSRIPVRRIFTPLIFSLFIIKTFYPEKWSRYEDEIPKADGFLNEFDRILSDSKRQCALLTNDLFTESEGYLPYID